MDTRQARQAIFARIRHAQKRPLSAKTDEQEKMEAYLAAHPVGPQPALKGGVIDTFCEQARRMSVTLDRIAERQQAPQAIRRYLDEHGIPLQAIAWPSLCELPWTEAGMQLEFRPPRDPDLVGITGTFCAVAETGTLLLLSGPDRFPSASLLPETHIAIVPASRILSYMEDAFALVRQECDELPRAANFISGPSRTGDIEQTIVLGAHGPYRVHVLIVDGE